MTPSRRSATAVAAPRSISGDFTLGPTPHVSSTRSTRLLSDGSCEGGRQGLVWGLCQWSRWYDEE
eukprot:2866-Eustigmatos_ZCMA.PRE.1